MSAEQKIKDLLKAAVNGDPTALTPLSQTNNNFTVEERRFIIEKLEALVGAKVTFDEESRCYVTVYPTGEVAYTRGLDEKGNEVSEAVFKKFIKRDQAERKQTK